jgi:Uncharacterised nucleotidyltransferase
VTEWSQEIPENQWKVYCQVIDCANERGIPFAIGGAFAMATLTGFWRDTKDLDIYALPEHRDAMLHLLNSLGFQDYFDTKPYDRWWIYRSTKDDTIVDLIWAMANHRAQIDELWMSGPEVEIRGRHLRVLPAEAILWDKLYIMQRERCDWPDAMNVLYWTCEDIDWPYLLERVGDDRPLLAGALTVFRWLSPGRAQKLPAEVWDCLGLPRSSPAKAPAIVRDRVDLLDRRPWYGPDRSHNSRAA